MKKKYVYYIVLIFLVGFGLNYIGMFGLGIWGMSEQREVDKKRKVREIPQEEWIADEQYKNYYEPKIDSFIQANPKQAIAYIDQLIKKYPKKDFLNLYKGAGLYKLDSFELAHREFKKAMEKAGYEYPTALTNSGWALVKMEKYDDAIIEFKKAIETNSEYLLDLAEVYKLKGDFTKAIQCYEDSVDRIEKKDPLSAKIDSNRVKYLADLESKISALRQKLK